MKRIGNPHVSGRTARFTGSAPLTVLGVTWTRGPNSAQVSVKARYKDANGWSAWDDLEVADAASDGQVEPSAAGHVGTVPLMAPDATAYDVVVTAPTALPTGLDLVLVDSATTAADRTAGQSASTSSAPGGATTMQDSATQDSSVAATTAIAVTPRPGINSRASWGADNTKLNCPPEYAPSLSALAVHHTAGSNSYTRAQVPSIIRGIYAYHTDGRGWCDIGYNVLVDRFGALWEGRLGGLDRNVVPAAQQGFNTGTTTISAMGTFASATAPSVMVDAIARFAAWRLSLAFIDPKSSTVMISGATEPNPKWAKGRAVRLPTIFGHRDVGYTDCPGDYLYAQLPTIRTKARAYTVSPAIFEPTMYYTTLRHTDFPAFRVNAHTTARQTWGLSVRNSAGTEIYRSSGSTYGTWLSADWDKRDSAGRPAPAGTYTLTLTSAAGTATARPWTGQVIIAGALPTPGDPAPLATVNRTPGVLYTSTHQWFSTCGPYSTATRCQVQIYVGGKWVQNNWAYHDWNFATWAGNPLAKPGTWTSGGRSFSTTCSPNVATGPRVCRANEWSVAQQKWVINAYVWLGDGKP